MPIVILEEFDLWMRLNSILYIFLLPVFGECLPRFCLKFPYRYNLQELSDNQKWEQHNENNRHTKQVNGRDKQPEKEPNYIKAYD